MKIVVIADTHMSDRAEKIPEDFLKQAKDADLILHAGDFVDLSVKKMLEEIAPLKAVWGNMDPLPVRNALKEKEIIEAEGVRIGLMHGRGHPDNLVNFLKAEFQKDNVDIIIFGHSHQSLNKKIDEILFLNPGSLTDIFFSDFPSYAVIQIDNGKYKARIEKLK